MWDKLSFAEGEKGSENGLVIRDEEYDFYNYFTMKY